MTTASRLDHLTKTGQPAVPLILGICPCTLRETPMSSAALRLADRIGALEESAMSKRLIVILAFLWIGSLIGVATVVAQVATEPVTPKVLSGSDVGFRVESIDHKSGSVMGHVVVNVNGKWVEAVIGGGTPKFTP